MIFRAHAYFPPAGMQIRLIRITTTIPIPTIIRICQFDIMSEDIMSVDTIDMATFAAAIIACLCDITSHEKRLNLSRDPLSIPM